MGFNLAHVSLLIGISGLSFCTALSLWQRISRTVSTRKLLCITFFFELLLVCSAFTAEHGLLAIVVIGIANGLYNGFFWTTQRTLFLQLLGNNDTGKRYGNFQIFVTVFLKIGILLGGWLLDAGGLPWLLALSTIVSGVSIFWFYSHGNEKPLHQQAVISFKKALQFKDQRGSRPVFIADGFFLFLESHFWSLSLFMLANENFTKLGFIVVGLAILFAVMFFLIKNLIDATGVSIVFRLAVALYAASWLARAMLSDEQGTQTIVLLLLLITFCSSFFRLAFNKRFFDIAQSGSGIEYLLIKSYISQLCLGLGFISSAVIMWITDTTTHMALVPMYTLAAAASLIYFLYRQEPHTTGS